VFVICRVYSNDSPACHSNVILLLLLQLVPTPKWKLVVDTGDEAVSLL
jgi:hypothetical protein